MIVEIIIIAFGVGFVRGQLNWWDIPSYYLRPGPPTVLFTALRQAALNDPTAYDLPYAELNKTCIAHAERAPPNPMLSLEQKAAIACYTQTAYGISWRINTAIRDLNAASVRAWSGFLKLFHTAVANLPTQSLPIFSGSRLAIYGNHPQFSVVTLPLSFTRDTGTARGFAMEDLLIHDPSHQCTIAAMYTQSARDISQYSFLPHEREFIMLPGSLGRVMFIQNQTNETCRIIALNEVDAGQIPHSTNVQALLNDPLTPEEMEKYNAFLRDYYNPSISVTVDSAEHLDIIINGGRDDAYNPFPFINHIIRNGVGSSSNLTVGLILTRVNGFSIRGMSHVEAKSFINTFKNRTSITYSVAKRSL